MEKVCFFCKKGFKGRSSAIYCSVPCASASPERRKKMGLSKLGDKHYLWKGDKVGYTSLHEWVKNRLKKPKLCRDCKKSPPYDLANISQKYKRDLDDWEWLCRRCHMKKDGRLARLRTSCLDAIKLPRKPYPNISGYKGVTQRKRMKHGRLFPSGWRASIRVNGKTVHLGDYPSKERAARVYDEVAKFVFGQIAVLNFK